MQLDNLGGGAAISDSDSDGSPKKNKKNRDMSSSDSENDEEYLDEVNDQFSPVKHQDRLQMAQKSRVSVSAEVFGKYHVKEAWSAKVI